MLAIVLAYIVLLLALALRADRPGRWAWSSSVRGVSYALSLSVLCTSWTYFGAVGTAMRRGWDFLPNFLGPVIALTLLAPLWRRIAAATKRENIGSVADFLASRYGKSRPLGALITCVAIVGALPYIALQMLSLSKAAGLLVAGGTPPAFVTPLIVAALAILAILFGARRPTVTQHNRGLIQVVTLEAVVKIVALVTVAVVAGSLLWEHPALSPQDWGSLRQWPRVDRTFLIGTLLCTVTMFTLPRVFHLGFVTLGKVEDIRTGQWLFPAYMALWAIAVVPIAIAGNVLHQGDPDLVVLNVPLRGAGGAVAMLALLGGFSAGAAMVMVEAIALSAMITNELVLPWMAKHHWGAEQGNDVGRTIVVVRRAAILAVLFLGYLYYLRMNVAADLSHLGFASLAASAQLAPALIGGVLWRRGNARGAIWGVVGGMTVWLVGVAAPQLEISEHLARGTGTLIGRTDLDLAIVSSLLLNCAIYVIASLRSAPNTLDASQADAFIGRASGADDGPARKLNGTVGDLHELLRRFLGPEDASRGLHDFGREYGRLLADDEPITPPIARAAERMLAGAIGASSARNVIALAVAGDEREPQDVGQILDEAANAVQFSREIIQAALDSLEQGVSVVDKTIRIVAWNQRYLELFSHSPADVYVGKPLERLIQAGSARAGLPASEAQSWLDERLGPMRRGESLSFERQWPNGRVLKVVGRRLSSGDYVTSFSDVTEIRLATRTLARMNEELEHRVQVRTQELTLTNAALGTANGALAEAKERAERVTAAQDRFISAASHDLLQPMHAARLYLAAASAGDGSPRTSQLLTRADVSIEAADRLLKALLHLSRIEVGGLAPEMKPIDLGAFLTSLRLEFIPIAAERGLELHVAATRAWGLSNADLLRSVLQNLIGNAIHYTRRGRVFVAVRPEGDAWRIEVRDSGPGIAVDAQEVIFREFTRLQPAPAEPSGSGLGLAIAQRICSVLGHRLALRSQPGRGSLFSVRVGKATAAAPAGGEPSTGSRLDDLTVLCVDDQPDVLQAEIALLKRWGVRAFCARSAGEALARGGRYDVVLADYHLGDGPDGLDLLRSFAATVPVRVLVTANASEAVREEAGHANVTVLRKPISPAALRSVLLHASRSAPTFAEGAPTGPLKEAAAPPLP